MKFHGKSMKIYKFFKKIRENPIKFMKKYRKSMKMDEKIKKIHENFEKIDENP